MLTILMSTIVWSFDLSIVILMNTLSLHILTLYLSKIVIVLLYTGITVSFQTQFSRIDRAMY